MEKVAEDKTLSRALTVLPPVFRRAVRNFVSTINITKRVGRVYGIQKIEFEGDPDVPLISKEDFSELQFMPRH